MKKSTLLLTLLAMPLLASAQYAFDALTYSQTELRGTSRYVAMGGAFGALGGDLTTLGQNPGGIGVYRNSDANLTLSLDFNKSTASGEKCTNNSFQFANIGYVGAFRLNSETMPTFNFGFSYNRINSYRRHYTGYMSGIASSVTDYLAEKANNDGTTIADMNEGYSGYARWDQIAAYRTYLINPTESTGREWGGLGYDGTIGEAEFEVDEVGRTDEYNISLGGNIKNFLYWGASLGIRNMVYEYYKYYGEVLTNTVIFDVPDLEKAKVVDGNASLGIVNTSRTTGTGVNGKFGVILKPINQLRFGVAVHTPTIYKMRDIYTGNISAEYYGEKVPTAYSLVEKYPESSNYYKIRTPWKFIGSVAGVIGNIGIISVDYEYCNNKSIRIQDDRGREYAGSTNEINTCLKPSHTIKIGAEVRVSPKFSLRAGYNMQTTGTSADVQDDKVEVEVASTHPAYTYDKDIKHITAGFGYHSGSLYFDMAYVYQNRKSNYHAFPGINYLPTLSTEVKDTNHRIQATLGFRF